MSLTPQTDSLKKKSCCMSLRPIPRKSVAMVTLWFACAFVIFVNNGWSQTVDADQRSLVRSQAPSPFGPNVTPSGVSDGHAVSTPNDTDLGEQQILKRVEEYDPFTVSIGAPFYWTSNVAL